MVAADGGNRNVQSVALQPLPSASVSSKRTWHDADLHPLPVVAEVIIRLGGLVAIARSDVDAAKPRTTPLRRFFEPEVSPIADSN